jgi:uncharacterized protein YuzE
MVEVGAIRMTVHFNDDSDTLTIVLRNSPVDRTLEIEHGIVDLDAAGEILAVEIFGASEIVEQVAHLAIQPSLEHVLAARAASVLHDVQQRVAEAKSDPHHVA